MTGVTSRPSAGGLPPLSVAVRPAADLPMNSLRSMLNQFISTSLKEY